MQGFVLSRFGGGSEGSGNSVCRNSLESEIFSRGEVGSIGDDVRLVEVEMVEILVRRMPVIKSPMAAIEQHNFGRHVREE